jgi:bacillithiol synthase
LLPTAAYVAGPGEVAYLAQIAALYNHFEIAMPVVYPRVSVTLVEAKVQRVLDRYELSLADVQGDIEAMHARLARQASGVDVDAAFASASRQLDSVMERLRPVAAAVDATLERSAEATRAGLQKEIDRLQERVVRAEKRAAEQVREQLDRARAGLFPEGELQERSLATVYFLNRFGIDLPRHALETLSLDTSEHQVMVMA